jgi:hypothetical protein
MGFELQTTVKFGNRLQSCNTLRYDLRADAVAGHYRNVVVPHAVSPHLTLSDALSYFVN